MRFKIVSVGWQCANWIEQTLRSVEQQSLDTWDIWITYDPSADGGADFIRAWCDARRVQGDDRWQYQINSDRRFACRNQYEAIAAQAPDEDDVVVFLDLDGDRLAHKDVLARLTEHYADGTLLTYGSYEPVPRVGQVGPVEPYPDAVVRDRSYRRFTLTNGCRFNHLRTMKGLVARSIPISEFQWPGGGWYEGGVDYVYMLCGLELANGRYKPIKETLLLYNHANPLADNLTHPQESTRCVLDHLGRPSLAPLP